MAEFCNATGDKNFKEVTYIVRQKIKEYEMSIKGIIPGRDVDCSNLILV